MRAFGARGREVLGPMRFFGRAEPLVGGADVDVVDTSPSEGRLVDDSWVVVVFDFASSSPPASSSTPNDNFPFATALRFFFGGGPRELEPLCFDHQTCRCVHVPISHR